MDRVLSYFYINNQIWKKKKSWFTLQSVAVSQSVVFMKTVL